MINMSGHGQLVAQLSNDPRVALTIIGESWYGHVSIRWRVVTVREDTDLLDADRLRYKGVPLAQIVHESG